MLYGTVIDLLSKMNFPSAPRNSFFFYSISKKLKIEDGRLFFTSNFQHFYPSFFSAFFDIF